MNDRLVECAKWYRHYQPPRAEALESVFKDEAQALASMRDVLLFEAHESMQEALKDAPEAPISNAIDLCSSAPGIARTHGGKIEMIRSDDVVREVTYDLRASHTDKDESTMPPQLNESRKRRFLQTSERAVERAHRMAERRAAESFMSKEERAAVAGVRREERTRRRDEKAALRQAAQTVDEGVGSDRRTASEEGVHVDTEDAHVDEVADEVASQANTTDVDGATATAKDPPLSAADPAEHAGAVDTMSEALASKKKKKVPGATPEYYESPAPHDRYLTALTTASLHPALRDTLLQGVPADNPSVRMTHGPPGTGKTHALLDALAEFHHRWPALRCLVCGPTNVSAADLYARAFERGIFGCLALSKEHMPPGVPRVNAIGLSSARFVFATVAGRSGRLMDEQFHAVFLDEAAMCPEAIVFGLLRPEVGYLWMVGDLKQLGALTSSKGGALCHGRSMMERLHSIGVRSTHLNVQYRMHPEICAFPSSAFYGGALKTAEGNACHKEVGMPYELLDVRGSVARVGTGYENVSEARAALDLATQLRDSGLHTVLLAPYAAQVRRIRAAQSGIDTYTVDAFQGKEADAIVLSIVRTPESGEGFWSDPRRLNVALTRAKHALRVVCHGGWETHAAASAPLGQLVADASRRAAWRQSN
jgi:hypothetical protein